MLFQKSKAETWQLSMWAWDVKYPIGDHKLTMEDFEKAYKAVQEIIC